MDNDKLKNQVEEALNSLFDALNKMGGEKEVEAGLKNVLDRQHRTLQQNFMSHIIIPSIKIFADKNANGFKDLRNEASCELATKLLPIVKDAYLPFV